MDELTSLDIDQISTLRIVLVASVAFHDQSVKPGSPLLVSVSLLSHLPSPIVIDQLEASFLEKKEALLAYWWREYAECSEGPRGSLVKSDESDSEDLYKVKEERVGVPVKGGLYEVDLMRRHCFPVYWNARVDLQGSIRIRLADDFEADEHGAGITVFASTDDALIGLPLQCQPSFSSSSLL